MLLGRGDVTARTHRLLDLATGGTSGSLVLLGDAGIGKSSLLDDAAAEGARRGFRVLAVGGVEAESDVPWAALADVVRPLLPLLGRLPAPQAEALRAALALGPGPSAGRGDRFGVLAGTLGVIAAAAETAPLLLLVDDAQWVDGFSLDALAFATRRLDVEGVVTLWAVRTDEVPLALRDAATVVVGGLPADAARELLHRAGADPTPPAVDRLLEGTDGNPLALLEIARTQTARELEEWADTEEPVPVGELVARAFGRQLTALPPATRAALRLLAVLDPAPPDLLRASLEEAGLAEDALDPAEEAGLVLTRGPHLRFRHPLLRAAVHARATSAQRRAAHGVVARALRGPVPLGPEQDPHRLDRVAGHLAAAGHGRDPELAAVLRGAARAALHRAAHASASRLLERAAEFAPPGDEEARDLLAAADAAQVAGAPERAARLSRQALRRSTDEGLAVAGLYHQCRVEMWRGQARTGRDTLADLGTRVAREDPLLGAKMLANAGLSSGNLGELARAVDLTAAAEEHLRAADRDDVQVLAVRALVLVAAGRPEEAAARLRTAQPGLAGADPVEVDHVHLVAALAHLGLEEFGTARALLDPSIGAARAEGAAGLLPFRLSRSAQLALWTGDWDRALAEASEAVRLAEDTGWLTELPHSWATLARVHALRGEATETRHFAGLALGDPAGLLTVRALAGSALGVLALAEHDDETALAVLGEVARGARAGGFGETPLLPWAGDLLEAQVRAGRHDEARDTVELLRTEAGASRRPLAAALAARGRALLATDDPVLAEAEFVRANEWHAQSPVPFEAARTRLDHGEFLRRRGRRAEARPPLQSALATFEQLGARAWAERARQELRATGIRLARTERAAAALTTQELQVAMVVAGGASNAEVATRMFLSVKTVEYHLGNVFRKLGVNRRTQLARVLADR
ncbi:LuxR C-terminal-related transcriptional regulator [Kineococcus gynurae]|uniref:LuxR C-terminal-related transcriptional regulator n=1 Tax=Kineococcus gynurae TaxID=452979 RepID=A0ABV5LQJ2_9ACTN